MANVDVNGVTLEYEIHGEGTPMLLVMGLGGQLTDWHPGLLDELHQRFTVIRFDNRDSGLSTYADAPAPTRWQLIKGNLWPPSIETSYTLDDMANDAGGLLAGLDIAAAHVVGMSMGGMIAQLLALAQPSRVLSLCSIMSHPGNRHSGRPTPRVLWNLARRGQPAREDVLDVTLELFRLVGGPDWDEAEQRRRSSFSLERAFNPAGVLRQSMAIAAAPNRTRGLRQLPHTTVVIHGLDDTLIQPSGGIATAKAIPDSRLLLLPRMGHDLPATRHLDIVHAIEQNTRRAGQQSS